MSPATQVLHTHKICTITNGFTVTALGRRLCSRQFRYKWSTS